jgi:predicted nucleic acid-binding Zn ribbon protein
VGCSASGRRRRRRRRRKIFFSIAMISVFIVVLTVKDIS